MNSQVKAYAALIVAVLFWGTSYIGTKVALEGFPPLPLAFLRFSVAALLFVTILVTKKSQRMHLGFHKRICGIAFILPGLYFIFENFGIKYTTAIKASLIAATIPVAVLILSTLIGGEKLTHQRIVSLILSLGGVFLLVVNTGSPGSGRFAVSVGDLLMVGAVVSAAFYMMMARKLSEDYPPFIITAYQMIYGALFFMPFFLFQAAKVNWAAAGIRQWSAVLVLAFFSTTGAFLAYNYALKRIPPGQAAMFINIVPFVTVVGSGLFLGEKLGTIQLGGGILVIAAACLANLTAIR